MITSKLFGFPAEEGLFDTVIGILTKQYGLVANKGWWPTTEYQRVLVWEDERGIGRYRVHCFRNQKWKITGDDRRYDQFHFRYWVCEARFDREVFSRDPMKEPLQIVLALSENRFEAPHAFLEISVEEIEKRVLEEKARRLLVEKEQAIKAK
ncbi:MAG: hypothetical protein V1659_02830 [Candidatus Woesearchaeota archaeon]